MCGIAGYAGLSDPALLRRMCGAIVHRGPDEDGYFEGSGVGLAIRRLAVIDLVTGSQPIPNEDRSVHVVLNGEIYNYEELRARLASAGHTLATASDTETIVHLYEEHGLDFVRHLRGMFAIALWDERRRRLVLVRDRIGEKPLHYALDGKRLFFGSEIKSILQAGLRREVEAQSVCDLLAAGYVAGSAPSSKACRSSPREHGCLRKGESHGYPYWEFGVRRDGSEPYRKPSGRCPACWRKPSCSA
jgi:asparagine synthase (glutamine-hydrolysing)